MPDSSPHLGLRLFETRNAKRAIACLLGIYTVAFLVFYPQGTGIADEGTYIRQAQYIVAGANTIEQIDFKTGDVIEVRPNDQYPLGTALLMAPFVALAGKPGAYLLSLVCLLAATALTARWLEEEGRSPLWAALILAYPPMIVLGRLAMSEAASMFIGVLGMWLFWRGMRQGPRWWIASGFVAGASLAFREANVLLFAPLFAGALLRRNPGWPALVLGGMAGVGVRLLTSWLAYDDPFFTKRPDVFSLDAALEVAPLYLFCLLVLVPGGLIAAFAYRGERRAELISTVAIFVSFHFVYAYSGQTSGIAKRLILGPRYFVPILPALAFVAAEVWPRWGASILERWNSRRAALTRLAGVVSASAVVVLAFALVGVQWAHASWSGEQTATRDLILDHTEPGQFVVTNWRATGKFIDLAGDGRTILNRDSVGADIIEQLLDQHGSFVLILLDRTDSEYWRKDAFQNRAYSKGIRHKLTPIVDTEVSPTDYLRIWRVQR